ncbi:DinB family protein [Candidatus Kaiserbacteria bacterium]|nr:DinB family protein [Candidatus Kaiserbacteria bacterium]
MTAQADSEWKGLVISGFSRLPEFLPIEDLSADELDWRPQNIANSIGWTVWHLIRVLDGELHALSGEEQVWIKEKWYQQFGRKADPEDTGFGHSADDVGAFTSPPPSEFSGYLVATLTNTEAYLRSLSAADLERELKEPYDPPPTVGTRIVSVLADCHQHAGEISYIRGLLAAQGTKL